VVSPGAAGGAPPTPHLYHVVPAGQARDGLRSVTRANGGGP